MTRLDEAFFNAGSFVGGDLSHWDVSSVTLMNDMFRNAYVFDGDLSNWNVAKATGMQRMFTGSKSFRGTGLSSWTGCCNSPLMSGMFENCKSMNADLSHWSVAATTDTSAMFKQAQAFNGDVTHWQVSNVVTMWEMFHGARSFNQDISGWTLSSATETRYILYQALSFNKNLCNWGNSIVSTSPDFMFTSSNCPTTADPDFAASPKGPFCFTC